MQNAETSPRIGAVAARHGVTQRTLRFYEQQGLLESMKGTYDRSYSKNDEVRLQMIVKGRRLGLSLSEIGDIIGYVDQRKTARRNLSQDGDILKLMGKDAISQLLDEQCRRRADICKAIEELEAALASHGSGLAGKKAVA